MYFDFREVNLRTNWIDNLSEFNNWLSYNQKQCIPDGFCTQDIMTTSGKSGLLKKYPDFESAYVAFRKEWDKYFSSDY